MSRVWLIIILAVLLPNISCKETVVVYEDPPLSIVGDWDWIQSVGMWGLVTPESEQTSRVFVFDGDSTFSDHYMRWGGDTSVNQSTYRFAFSAENETRGTLYIGDGGGRGGGITFFVWFTCTDESELESAGVESETSIFKRRTTVR